MWDARLSYSGIAYSESYAWHEAARWRGLTDRQMEVLEGNDQARVIAQWETHERIDAIIAWDMERKRRRGT